MKPQALLITEKLGSSGQVTLNEITGWFECEPMKTIKILGKLVEMNVVYRVGWTEEGASLWSLKPQEAELAEAA